MGAVEASNVSYASCECCSCYEHGVVEALKLVGCEVQRARPG